MRGPFTACLVAASALIARCAPTDVHRALPPRGVAFDVGGHATAVVEDLDADAPAEVRHRVEPGDRGEPHARVAPPARPLDRVLDTLALLGR